MKNKKMEIYFPDYLTKEAERCIILTLESLGVKDIQLSKIDNEILEIIIPQEKLESVKIFLNLLAIADMGGHYTQGLTE